MVYGKRSEPFFVPAVRARIARVEHENVYVAGVFFIKHHAESGRQKKHAVRNLVFIQSYSISESKLFVYEIVSESLSETSVVFSVGRRRDLSVEDLRFFKSVYGRQRKKTRSEVRAFARPSLFKRIFESLFSVSCYRSVCRRIGKYRKYGFDSLFPVVKRGICLLVNKASRTAQPVRDDQKIVRSVRVRVLPDRRVAPVPSLNIYREFHIHPISRPILPSGYFLHLRSADRLDDQVDNVVHIHVFETRAVFYLLKPASFEC